MEFFAPCPKGLEYLLVDELEALGASRARETRAGVAFEGPLQLGLRACLWSRLASRVLLPLAEFAASDADALYEGVAAVDWAEHLDPRGSLAITVDGRAEGLRHSRFAAQRAKDAIVDQFRRRGRVRPAVDLDDPDLRLHLRLHRGRATLSVDLAGSALHRRGYRQGTGEAPLKENLAAAVLLRAGWPALAAQGAPLLDPMCGSGTLLIEGALIAGDIAPGLLRERWGLLGWAACPTQAWRALRTEAEQRARAGRERLGRRFFGSDSDADVLEQARANIAQAGLSTQMQLRHCSVDQARPPDGLPAGLVVCNPPYDTRMAADPQLYADLGAVLGGPFAGWAASVLVPDNAMGRAIGLRASKRYVLFNGALECLLVNLETSGAPRRIDPRPPQSEGALALKNRLEKNRRTLRSWLRRENLQCYRVYDADLPEYASAIDVYGEHLHVQEYQAPPSVPEAVAERRFRETLEVAAGVFGVPLAQVHAKTRRRQRGREQYRKQAQTGRSIVVDEDGLKFLVNLDDYLDTGLFLDHRPMRRRIRALAHGRRFLNLFCYTGTATVHAAAGGATQTTSVDLSPTYLTWAARNLALNGFDPARHRLLRADVMGWLDDPDEGPFDLIFVDPPTFSNSARTDTVFDVQRDHVRLLQACAKLLADGGRILFSTNHRRFKLDGAALADFALRDFSRASLPPDFARNPRIHQAWELVPRRV